MSAGLVEAVPSDITDSVNAQILAVSDGRVPSFAVEPFAEIAALAGLPETLVVERLKAMLAAGVIRGICHPLLATNLAPVALVAWQVSRDCLEFAFTYLAKDDPCSSRVVIRSTDGDAPGSEYRLWTTLKVPLGFSMLKHCEFVKEQIGAAACRILPARGLFTIGDGGTRPDGIQPGSRTEEPGRVIDADTIELGDLDWRVLTALKREFTVDEIHSDPWRKRARDAGESLDEFVRVATWLAARGVIGRFSASLEHATPSSTGTRVPRYDALFQWRVPDGREIEAGKEVGRHHIITDASWRETGPEFGNVNIMAVAQETEKEVVLEHKSLIDEHLREAGIPILYTNVFWGRRSGTKPSEISPVEYALWCRRVGCDPREMRNTVG